MYWEVEGNNQPQANQIESISSGEYALSIMCSNCSVFTTDVELNTIPDSVCLFASYTTMGWCSHPGYGGYCAFGVDFQFYLDTNLVEETSVEIGAGNSTNLEEEGFSLCHAFTLPGQSISEVKITLRRETTEMMFSYVDDIRFISTNVTGLEEDNIELDEIRIFPNPVSNRLFIDAANSESTYAIYNYIGKLLKEDSYQAGVDVSELPTGNYFIELQDSDGIVRRSRFVVE